MDKIIDQVKSWEYLGQLPAEIAGFSLTAHLERSGTQYYLFSYENASRRRKLSVLFDKATKDFFARITLGLSEYYDVSFITTELASLERILKERLEHTLERLADPASKNYESIFRNKKILEWHFIGELPDRVAGFELFITPKEPVKIINGSYIIIDYSDFNTASNLIIYYNVYRDEFFGELRMRRSPRMINQFDAKELVDLTDKLKSNLAPVLSSLRTEIDRNEF